MRKSFSHQHGFSIVQVMVAIGLSGVLALVVMKISQNMSTVQSEAEGAQEESELKLHFRQILDNEDHCSVSLAGLDPIGSPVKFKKTQIDEPALNEGMNVELYVKSNTTRTKRFTYNPNDNSPTLIFLKKLKIKEIKLAMENPPLVNYPAASKHSDTGTLVVLVEKNKRQKRYKLPLSLTMTTDTSGWTTILSCRSVPAVDPCPPLGMVLDQTTSLCRPPKTQATGYARSSKWGGIWGNWGGWDMCTKDRGVCGIQTKIEGGQGGGDDTALNAVRFICCNALPFGHMNQQDIFSAQGGWGGWGFEQYCPAGSYARGIHQKFENSQGGGDDTATNAVELRCNDAANTLIKSSESGWGGWDTWGQCPNNEFICGLRTRVEPGQGGGDDTAFNGIEVRCCTQIE